MVADPAARSPLDLTPAEFARNVLGIGLYPWQERILTDLDQPGRFSLRAANESGKTTTIFAPFIGWFLTVYPRGKVICTAGVYRQVTDQLWPKLARFGPAFGWDVNVSTLDNGRGGFARGFRAVDPDLFEGYHGDDASAPLAILVDEAKSVTDGIFTAIERCRPHWLLVASSPGECVGEFYRSHSGRRAFYKTYTVTAADCPHIPPAKVEEQIAMWGKDHPLIRSMIFAEFTRQSEAGAVVALADLEAALRQPPVYQAGSGKKRAACDFAAGGDENVLAIAQGNKVEVVAAWRERNTMTARDAFISLFVRHGLKPENICGDNGGLGIPLVQALAEKGWPIQAFNFGAAANQPELFANRGAEIWHEFGAAVRRGEWILPGQDEELVAQLTSRRGARDGRGRLKLEDKEAMRARGLSSPDRADAVIMATCHTPAVFEVLVI